MGNYQIVSEIGKGGMSHVYKATFLVTGQERALKVLPPNSSDERVSALKWEAEISHAIGEHPNIVRVYEEGEQNGWSYLGMELINGESLESLIKRGVKPGVRRSLEIAASVAYGLEYIHGRNIFHADIKPGNILVNDHVKITDFGIAYDANRKRPLLQKGIIIGTVNFIAPERIYAAKDPSCPDARTDIYSLGAALYHMLTGNLPFDDKTDRDVMTNILIGMPASPSGRNKDIPASVSELCLKALEKEPEKRFHSAREFIEAADKVLNSCI